MKPLADRSVSLIHYSCPPVIGGAEFILEAQARWLYRYGADVRVLVGEGDSFHDDIPVRRVEQLQSDYEEWRSLKQSLLEGDRDSFHESVERFTSELEDLTAGSDTAIVHNLFTMPFNMIASVAVRQWAESSPLQTFAWTHDIAWLDDKYDLEDRFPWNQLKQPAAVTSYVAISDLRKQQLDELFHGSVDTRVVHDAVEFDVFHELDPILKNIYRDHKMYRSDVIGIYPARIVRRKNFELALRIVKGLKELGNDIHFIVTGPPDPHNKDSMVYFEELLELRTKLGLEDEVVFCYELTHPESGDRLEISFNRVRQLYRISDVLLMTSRQEGFGLPILEAALTRTVICCSDIDPLPEVGGEAPIYFDLEDPPTAIAGQIHEHLETQAAVKLQRRVRQRFTWPAVFENEMIPLLNDEFPLSSSPG